MIPVVAYLIWVGKYVWFLGRKQVYKFEEIFVCLFLKIESRSYVYLPIHHRSNTIPISHFFYLSILSTSFFLCHIHLRFPPLFSLSLFFQPPQTTFFLFFRWHKFEQTLKAKKLENF
ncbi:hypothetical protein L6452_09814 [Arctium lappa]|uniref:Uncharacterized protein n=1 Tax=Arctium lappa TaxID=4217 RepID=A0ACB9DLE7_ARCLA|nr:hypothetical protein L6452_09814 [Arctium lappa]